MIKNGKSKTKKLIVIEPPEDVTPGEFHAMVEEIEAARWHILMNDEIRKIACSRKSDWHVHVSDAEVQYEKTRPKKRKLK
jgi:hypothetical protein